MPKHDRTTWTSTVTQSVVQAGRGADANPAIVLSYQTTGGGLVSLDSIDRLRDQRTGRLTEEAWQACERQGVPPLLLDAAKFLRLPGMEQQPVVNKALARSLGLVTEGVEDEPKSLQVVMRWDATSQRASLTVTHATRTIKTLVSGQTHVTFATEAERVGTLADLRTFEAYQKLDDASLKTTLAASMPTCTTTVAATFEPTDLARSIKPNVQAAFAVTFGSRMDRLRAMCQHAEVRTAFLFLTVGACALGVGGWVMPLPNGVSGGLFLLGLGAVSLVLSGMFWSVFSKQAYAEGQVTRTQQSLPSVALRSGTLGAAPTKVLNDGSVQARVQDSASTGSAVEGEAQGAVHAGR